MEEEEESEPDALQEQINAAVADLAKYANEFELDLGLVERLQAAPNRKARRKIIAQERKKRCRT
jgi:hypothetical protein